jgi:hypothetical protein
VFSLSPRERAGVRGKGVAKVSEAFLYGGKSGKNVSSIFNRGSHNDGQQNPF